MLRGDLCFGTQTLQNNHPNRRKHSRTALGIATEEMLAERVFHAVPVLRCFVAAELLLAQRKEICRLRLWNCLCLGLLHNVRANALQIPSNILNRTPNES